MSAYILAPQVVIADRDPVARIFDAVGESLEVNDEDLLNGFTAIAGSGPAYLYYLIESWREAACSLGFSREDSEKLITQTITGSLWLWTDSGNDEEGLRQRVTSKGGTTEAALAVFDQGKLKEIFKQGILRASARSAELEKLVREKM